MEEIKWIRLPNFCNGQYIVHEVKCPKCKCHFTYIGVTPDRCDICEERRES